MNNQKLNAPYFLPNACGWAMVEGRGFYILL